MGKIEIMCTLSAAQIAGRELVEELAEAGMGAVRINTAHLHGPDELAGIASRLKDICPRLKILIDTKGPEMRTTAIDSGHEAMLDEGGIVEIEGRADDAPSCRRRIVVNYAALGHAVDPGDRLLIDDGRLVLSAEAVSGGCVRARVVRGGLLGSRKGFSIAGKEPDFPAVGAHDLEYIRMAASSELIDMVAHSFVRRAADVEAVRQAMALAEKPVIAKIENRLGIDNLDEITAVADGILIARGDLTATLGADAVAGAQAAIAATTVGRGLPLVLATNILPSMLDCPDASEADLRGIRLALSQGVGTLLLTNETAAGHFPVECVRTLAAAIRESAR